MTGRRWAEVRDRAETGLRATVEFIRGIGLRVSLPKTEACGFHRPRNRLPNGLALSSGGIRIGVRRTLKCLGVTFDSGLTFGQHLALLGPKIRAVSASLGRLMPNLRGPRARIRRLYATVVHYMGLYGAQVWAESVAASRPLREKAIQLLRASLAAEVACLLSGTPPLDLFAAERLVLYRERGRGGRRGARFRGELRVRTVRGKKGQRHKNREMGKKGKEWYKQSER